jgi:hypothetical protein
VSEKLDTENMWSPKKSPIELSHSDPSDERLFINEDHAESQYFVGEHDGMDVAEMSNLPVDPSKVWVVYGGDIASEIQQAAFTYKEYADRLAEYLESSALVEMTTSEVEEVLIDKYAEQIGAYMKPFFVALIDGNLFEVYGFGTEDAVHELIEPLIHEDGKSCSGTFWGKDKYFAVDQAMKFWKMRLDS